MTQELAKAVISELKLSPKEQPMAFSNTASVSKESTTEVTLNLELVRPTLS